MRKMLKKNAMVSFVVQGIGNEETEWLNDNQPELKCFFTAILVPNISQLCLLRL